MTKVNDGVAAISNALRFAVGKSSLGPILIASSNKGICAILFGSDPEELVAELRKEFPDSNLVASDGDYGDVITKVLRLVDAPASGFDLPLDLSGTDFQRRVWQALREIPAGATASYSEVAERIGAPKEPYAVGEACAANKIAIAIPCHRVVRKDGALAGYRWGVKRKRALLMREAKGLTDRRTRHRLPQS